MGHDYRKVGAAAGAFYVFAIMLGGSMGQSGASGATDGQGILANLQRDPTTVNTVGFALEILGFAAFLVFLGYLHRVLRRAEGRDGWLGTVALGAGLLYLAIKVGSAAPLMAAVDRRDDLTPAIARTLVDLNDAAFVVSCLMLGLFVAAAAVVCIAHRVLPRWLGWCGLAVGLLTVVAATAGIIDAGTYNPLPFLGGLLWTLIASVVLTMRGERPIFAYDDPARAGEAGTRVGA